MYNKMGGVEIWKMWNQKSNLILLNSSEGEECTCSTFCVECECILWRVPLRGDTGKYNMAVTVIFVTLVVSSKLSQVHWWNIWWEHRILYERTSPNSIFLHWLPVIYRLQYRMLVFACKASHATAHQYSDELVIVCHLATSSRTETLLTVP